ncbi:MAG TPA: aminopeptidase [Clostridia bacterium]|nr:aminopeptidase [Clostridia bacterium]
MSEKETAGQVLEGRLTRAKKKVWETLGPREREEVFVLADRYKSFVSRAKTERESAREIMERARGAGFVRLDELRELRPGQRFFICSRKKIVLLGVWGENSWEEGFRLVGAHLDAPRLDVKPQPLYESDGLALMKTHYYGGIKKYQWPALPLAIHGIVITSTGREVELVLGENQDEPVFTVTDLLPHLAREQMEKKLVEGIRGEDLNLLVGSLPYPDEAVKEKVKLAVLDFLHRQYGLIEEDLVSAELEVVPAGTTRDVGFDRGLVGGYGQDDRICVFTALEAILELERPARTALALFVDKEEIGSVGNTGARSRFLESTLARLHRLATGRMEDVPVWDILNKSMALSADTMAGLDPNYPDVLDKFNAPVLGNGVVLLKYTGSGGKYDASDAHAETVAQVRRLFNEQGIIWQGGELGKVDQGGGGTIARFLAELGLDVLDCGPALLGIHSPFEVASKGDLYMSYKAYQVFLEK